MMQRRIEEASLNAWPALQQIFYDGWVLRFAKGYTKRANSVNPLFGSSMDVEDKVEQCEQIYADRRQPAIFRITPFADPPDLDRVLERRRYKRLDQTLVQHIDLRGQTISPDLQGDLRNEPLDIWMEFFCKLSRSGLDKHETHKEMLKAIPSRRFLASLRNSGDVVACGLGVLENEYFGLFDIVPDPRLRNQGNGTKLTTGMLRWAHEQGAAHAYLQVVANNATARHLYDKVGFREVYQYWYRVPESTEALAGVSTLAS